MSFSSYPAIWFFFSGQLLVLSKHPRTSVTGLVERRVKELGLNVDVAFCPERIAQRARLTELFELPEIVSGRTPAIQEPRPNCSGTSLEKLYSPAGRAEVAKLFTNAWRYIKMATANQFYTIANRFGLDYDKIRVAIAQGIHARLTFPVQGSRGPCLLKDTMQLAAFTTTFVLGHASMMVNEGLPQYSSHAWSENKICPLRAAS